MKRNMMTAISGVFLTALITIGIVSAQEIKHTARIRVNNVNEGAFVDLANIPFESAVKTALKAVPGKVLKAELENEDGYLVYGIEVAKANRQIADVKIDAGTGKILKIDKDQKDSEDHEGENSDNDHEEREER
jgi:hypothetical protein